MTDDGLQMTDYVLVIACLRRQGVWCMDYRWRMTDDRSLLFVEGWELFVGKA